MTRTSTYFATCFVLLVWSAAAMAQAPKPPAGLLTFSGPAPEVPRRDVNIDYSLDLSKERYFFFSPAAYSGKEPYGLIVYTTPGAEMTELPAGWKAVLEQRKLLFLAAQAVGNDQPSTRRCGLAVLGALAAMQKHKVDPNRVYAAGFSGGARMSGRLGLYQSEIFHGTIQTCGADFYEAVPQVHPVPDQVRAMGSYGLIQATQEEIALAKPGVRFVFITGAKDFRYPDIQNLYEGGFAKAGFKAKLIDVPGMGHEEIGPKTLKEALDFIEAPGGRSASAPSSASASSAASAPSVPAPAWMALPTNRWPQILLELDITFKDKTRLVGASGFLTRLPNGAVVAATAKHAACNEKSVDAFESSFTSFLMHPRTTSERQVRLFKTAIKPADANRMDCLLMIVPPQTWPVEVRPARATPAEEGETVYLVAVPYDDRSPQNVYKGTVRRSHGDDQFAYDFTEKVDHRGFSGAPVLDAKGNVVGIHLGSLNYPDGTTFLRALNMSAAVGVCTAPAPPQPPTRPAPAPPAKPTITQPAAGKPG
jgi:predicted esterase